MSNHLTCPACSRISSDNVWPADGWGNIVTQERMDGASGTEDPVSFAQHGETIYRCPCGETAWIANVGWFLFMGSDV